jgi:hypothetical protein
MSVGRAGGISMTSVQSGLLLEVVAVKAMQVGLLLANSD